MLTRKPLNCKKVQTAQAPLGNVLPSDAEFPRRVPKKGKAKCSLEGTKKLMAVS
jgi:hypothetical protein